MIRGSSIATRSTCQRSFECAGSPSSPSTWPLDIGGSTTRLRHGEASEVRPGEAAPAQEVLRAMWCRSRETARRLQAGRNTVGITVVAPKLPLAQSHPYRKSVFQLLKGLAAPMLRPMVREPCLRAYVGVTDWDWYQFLRARGSTEVNFWQPSGGRRFGAIPQGAPFLFKTHYSHGNRIVGGGFLSGWASLPISRAWEFFGLDNGCSTLAEMRARIARYRGRHDMNRRPGVGCVMLRDVSFFEPDTAPAAPPDWSANIVQGRSYALASPEGSYIEEVLHALLEQHALEGPMDSPSLVEGDIFGAPRLTPVRLGQQL